MCVPPQERTGVKMVMIQDGPLPTGADKPLRMTGDPFKVQVGEQPLGPGLGAGPRSAETASSCGQVAVTPGVL